MRKSRKSIVITGTVAGVLVGGAAFAYWTASGDGTGAATTSAGASNLAVNQTSSISNMYPGDSAQTIRGTVENKAANSAYVASVTATIAGVTKATGVAGTCDATDFTLASAVMPVAQDIASGATVTFSGATIKFNNKNENQDACKGATVNLAYAAR